MCASLILFSVWWAVPFLILHSCRLIVDSLTLLLLEWVVASFGNFFVDDATQTRHFCWPRAFAFILGGFGFFTVAEHGRQSCSAGGPGAERCSTRVICIAKYHVCYHTTLSDISNSIVNDVFIIVRLLRLSTPSRGWFCEMLSLPIFVWRILLRPGAQVAWSILTVSSMSYSSITRVLRRAAIILYGPDARNISFLCDTVVTLSASDMRTARSSLSMQTDKLPWNVGNVWTFLSKSVFYGHDAMDTNLSTSFFRAATETTE